MALDTAWPWANDTYGLCCLRAYFCAHKHIIRARSYVVIPQIGIAMGFLLQIRMSWLRALSKGCRCWCWCCGQSAPVLVSADCARCGGAVSWLYRLHTFWFQPVACQQVVGFCLAIWVYAGVIWMGHNQPFRFQMNDCCLWSRDVHAGGKSW